LLTFSTFLDLWLANCYFAHDSLGFPSCYHSSMGNLVVLFIHLIATMARLLGPGGVRLPAQLSAFHPWLLTL
jgi:hypothetical protein